MPPLPDNAHQATPYPTALENNPSSRSISDDDLCARCSHLLYRPGERCLCSLSTTEGSWPSRCDENGYAQSCPSLQLNQSPQSDK
ncbi:hypothetical protein AM387_20380 [Klebsiella pneumoniae]|nr:hypothetical protein AM388_26385 [Klebsiella pneumoniae]EIW9225269.1 hypothetical protein [Klebsiella pneumoniae subsp. ozaenae]AWD98599.1 hypothetical protein AM389_26685 [Klebsiella pneumoniae]AWS85776.1 hypothetical protein AM387_20380 [Klebsiella pneumoniae]EIW9082141.1 hypothetical protein [Klebsiella pneumoniae]